MQVKKESKIVGLEKEDVMNRARWRVGVGEIGVRALGVNLATPIYGDKPRSKLDWLIWLTVKVLLLCRLLLSHFFLFFKWIAAKISVVVLSSFKFHAKAAYCWLVCIFVYLPWIFSLPWLVKLKSMAVRLIICFSPTKPLCTEVDLIHVKSGKTEWCKTVPSNCSSFLICFVIEHCVYCWSFRFCTRRNQPNML